jgi:hypothetical protein
VDKRNQLSCFPGLIAGKVQVQYTLKNVKMIRDKQN